MPGYTDVRAYPLTPDLGAARKLTGGKRRAAVLYTCNQSPCDQKAQIVKANLAAIGIDVEVKAYQQTALWSRIARADEPFDLAFTGWVASYPDPNDFLNTLLQGGGSGTTSPFDDPAYRGKIAAAAKLSGPRRYLAFGKLDTDLVRNAAPWAAYANVLSRDFFSARMGCQVYQPIYGMDLAALCIRPR
jgi:ABC-type oligopeptide transport system substrate-binding subunit